MVKRLALVLLILGGATATVPALRARAAPRVAPLWQDMRGWWGQQLRPLLDPVFRWSATNELRSIVRDLKQRENSFQPLPDPRRFQEYLQRAHLSGRDGRDPWGTPYYLVLSGDSITGGSAGPDRERGTPDDIRVSLPRR